MKNKQEKIADTLNVNSDIPASIIVHGPQGCGKTRNALILTNTRYESDEIAVMTFHDAMKQTGLIRTL